MTLVFYSFIEVISESFEGTGIEVFYSMALALIWISLAIATLLPSKRFARFIPLQLLIGVAAFVTLKGVSFLIYFGVSWQTSSSLLPVVLGCVIGIGICISFSILLKFLLSETLLPGASWMFSLLWFAFLAGQFSEIIGLLSQVDYISVGPPLFTMNSYINDASEYGHVLNALLGYESSPSLTFIGFYLTVFCLPIGLKVFMQKLFLNRSLEGNQK